MARSPYFSTYRQYKADTDVIATYLATTAKQTEPKPELDATKLSKHAKSKAKKRAKAAGQPNPTRNNDQSCLPNYVIPIRDFEPLAIKIASLTPAVTVPHQVLSSIRRAISLRKQMWSFLIARPKGPQETHYFEDGKDGHTYFVTVLETVRDILEPLSPREKTKFPPQHKTEEPLFSNLFDKLDLEEPSEEFLNTPATPRDGKDTKNETPIQIDYEAERQEDFCEAMIAFACHLRDLMMLRTTSSDAWRRHHKGILPFPQAAIITNTVLELARCLEEDLSPMFSSFGGSKSMFSLLVLLTSVTEMDGKDGKETDHRGRLNLFGDDNNDFFQCALALLPVTTVLFAYLDGKKQGKAAPVPTPIENACASLKVQEQQLSDRMPSSKVTGDCGDQSQSWFEAYYLHTESILLEVIPLMEAYRDELNKETTVSKSAVDEFTRGVFHMIDTQTTPLWVIFAAQTFVDVHNELDHNTSKCFLRFKSLLLMHHNSLWYTDPDSEEMDQASLGYDWVNIHRDLDADIMEEIIKHTNWQKPEARRGEDDDSHPLLHAHPILCGLKEYYFMYRFHTLGVKFANRRGFITGTAHLYSAIRREKLIQKEWRDMRSLFFVQQPNLFVDFESEQTDDLGEYLRRYELCLGFSAADFARDNSRKKNARSKASSRRERPLLRETPIWCLFADRYVSPSTKRNMSVDMIESIVAQGTLAKNATLHDDLSSYSHQIKQLSPRDRHTVGLKDLIKNLIWSLERDFPEFALNYFLMDRQCTKVLRAVKAAVISDLDGNPGALLNNSSSLTVVSIIFISMSMDQTLTRELKLPTCQDGSFRPSRKLLEIAAKAYDRLLSDDDDTSLVGDELIYFHRMRPNFRLIMKERGRQMDLSVLWDLTRVFYVQDLVKRLEKAWP